MEWRDDGIILGVRRHGEASVLLEVMTRGHGRHLGLVRGGRSRRLQPALQPGNGVALVWRARLDEHLGTYAVEPLAMRAARFMDSPAALYALANAAALLRFLPERDPHEGLYEALTVLADHLHEPVLAAALTVRFELAMLCELGFGLDLTACAATGVTSGLAYVSPKSGRAVSQAAGEPYRDRLLPLPAFLRRANEPLEPGLPAIRDGFRLTGAFLERDVYGPRGLPLPDVRHRLVEAALKAAGETSG